ncbi:MAG: DNA repair and recombination protein RadB [Candidatus Altiarchaeales archaeon ex4484_2]|nr:MAG: DNA repair and recombination protein RadB [Candidatus Altiarchaeales archaeon ex4484_2]
MINAGDKLDGFLGGGLIPRTLTCVYGPPASGKTNLALIAASKVAMNDKTVFVDAEGGFSIERLKQICGEDLDTVLENILVLEPHDFNEQRVAVSKLDEVVRKTETRLVIVDSIGVLYRLEERRDTKELGRMLAKLMEVARKNDIPVLLTNQVYTDIDTGVIVPVGGSIIKYWCKVIIELESREGYRRAVLRKHKFLKEGRILDFTIADEGIMIKSGVTYGNQEAEDC